VIDSCYVGDVRDGLRAFIAAGTRAQTCVTSPPYWGLRDYGIQGQLGLESTPAEYVAGMVEVFRLVREVLADDGTLWLNLGDSYARSFAGCWGNESSPSTRESHSQIRSRGTPPEGLKAKDLVGIPWRVALALQADGWYLRSDIIWHKPNPMPEAVTDRPTKAHEYLFLLSKSERYYYDAATISERSAEGTRNRRSVWVAAAQTYADAHFAVMPRAIVEPCVLAGSRVGDTVLDPFLGSGTVAQVAQDLGRRWIGCELNPEYVAMQRKRTAQAGLVLA
jgi:DNA modification methylase